MNQPVDIVEMSDQLTAFDALMHRGEANTRTRSGIMAIQIMDSAPDWRRFRDDKDLLQPGDDLDARRWSFHEELLAILDDVDHVEVIANRQFTAREPATRNTFRRPRSRR